MYLAKFRCGCALLDDGLRRCKKHQPFELPDGFDRVTEQLDQLPEDIYPGSRVAGMGTLLSVNVKISLPPEVWKWEETVSTVTSRTRISQVVYRDRNDVQQVTDEFYLVIPDVNHEGWGCVKLFQLDGLRVEYRKPNPVCVFTRPWDGLVG